MIADMPKVFFSYAREDAAFVLKLASDLRAAGIDLWIDQLDITPGERWDSAVETALKNAPFLLVVLSPASVGSQNVMDEVAYALENNKKVVPVLHARCVVPFRLQRLQYTDFTLDYDNGLAQLLKALNAGHPAQTSHEPPNRSEDIAPDATAIRGEKRTLVNTPTASLDSLLDANIRPAPGSGFWRSPAAILASVAVVIAAITALVFVMQKEPPQLQSRAPQLGQANAKEPTSAKSNVPPPRSTTPTGAAKVFIHTSVDRDLAVLEEVGNALRAKGFEVFDTRLSSVKTAGDVRFFFPQDRIEADRLKSAVESELGNRGYPLSLQLLERDGTKFQYAAPGKIEIWLPSLTKNIAKRQ